MSTGKCLLEDSFHLSMLVFFLFCFESVRYAGSAWAFCGFRIRMRMDARRHQLCALSLFSSRHFISSCRLSVRLILLRGFIKPCSCCRYRCISTKKAPPQGDTFSFVRVSVGRYSLGCCFLFFRSSFLSASLLPLSSSSSSSQR
ncbi:hypothetical protein IWX49DRAFT_564054, partial [Phyllosticta citricarpa]